MAPASDTVSQPISASITDEEEAQGPSQPAEWAPEPFFCSQALWGWGAISIWSHPWALPGGIPTTPARPLLWEAAPPPKALHPCIPGPGPSLLTASTTQHSLPQTRADDPNLSTHPQEPCEWSPTPRLLRAPLSPSPRLPQPALGPRRQPRGIEQGQSIYSLAPSLLPV